MVTPLVSAWRLHRLWKSLVRIRSGEDLQKLLAAQSTRETLIDALASENRVPRIFAERLYRLIEKRLEMPPPG
jgi:hypothetical protein